MSDPVIGIDKTNGQVLTGFGVNMYGMILKEGGRWGDIYANKVAVRHANGALEVDASGVPVAPLDSAQGAYVGNPLPKFTLGWNNTIDYKNLSISFLIDGRFGGQVVSVTQAYLDIYGYSKASADARDNGGVDVKAELADGTPYVGTTEGKLPAMEYYSKFGNRSGVAGEYVYSATNVRLRELSIGYKLPVEIKGIRNVSLSFVARNLFFFTKKAPFDPDITMSTGNGLQGVDVFSLPSTRSYGLNLKVGF